MPKVSRAAPGCTAIGGYEGYTRKLHYLLASTNGLIPSKPFLR